MCEYRSLADEWVGRTNDCHLASGVAFHWIVWLHRVCRPSLRFQPIFPRLYRSVPPAYVADSMQVFVYSLHANP